jgi:hypothetical protein
LEGTYYDRILNMTSFWTPKGNILRSIGGNPTGITNDLKELLRLEWIEKKDGIAESGQKIVLYRRIDMSQTLDQLENIMTTFELNKETAIEEMIKMKYCITTKNPKKISKKGKELLSWIQSELLDSAFMVTIRIKYQGTLGLLLPSVMNQRVKVVERFIDEVMKELALFKNDKMIKEYFQNHTHKLEPFKI